MDRPKRSSSVARRKGSLNDVRAPMMMLYTLVFCGSRMSQLPVFGSVLGGAAIMVGVALLLDRKQLGGRFRFSARDVVFAMALACLLSVVWMRALDLIASLSFAVENEPGLIGGFPVLNQAIAIETALRSLPLLLVVPLGALIVGPAEELFYRGFVQRRLVARLGLLPGVLITSALYAGFYGILINPLALVVALVVGVIASVLAERTEGLLAPVVLRSSLWLLVPVVY